MTAEIGFKNEWFQSLIAGRRSVEDVGLVSRIQRSVDGRKRVCALMQNPPGRDLVVETVVALLWWWKRK